MDGVRVYSAGGERWKQTRVSLTNAVVLLSEGPDRDWRPTAAAQFLNDFAGAGDET